jgi:phage/plasmid-associated DNA primase
MIFQDSGHSKPEAEQLMGWAEKRPWKLVSLPFQPEYPGNRQWNRNATQLAFQPIPRDEEPVHPHWDLILEHIGSDLSKYLAKLDWAIESGIRTGGDYLRAFFASIIRDPLEHTPYLFLFGEENSGKSIFHEAFSLLVTSGVVKADRALTSRSDFNGELAGAILCVVEEKDIGKTPGALAKIKDASTAEFLSIRKMRTDPYMARNFTHWVQCNNDFASCPVFPGDSRITVIYVPPFTGTEIPKRQLLRKLEEEAPAFLRTVIDMILPHPMGRLRIPIVDTEHRKRLQDFAKSWLDTFIDENVTYDDRCMILFSEFYDRFLTWLPPDELSKWSRASVSRALPTKHKTASKTANKTYVMNARWTAETKQ